MVIQEVIDISGCALDDLPPLYEAIDPDALNALYDHGAPAIEFQYAGYHIKISPEQTISVTHEN
ncbi:HalOD1 output domain-containing protein [Haladaptatus pallidirubidus]